MILSLNVHIVAAGVLFLSVSHTKAVKLLKHVGEKSVPAGGTLACLFAGTCDSH